MQEIAGDFPRCGVFLLKQNPKGTPAENGSSHGQVAHSIALRNTLLSDGYAAFSPFGELPLERCHGASTRV